MSAAHTASRGRALRYLCTYERVRRVLESRAEWSSVCLRLALLSTSSDWQGIRDCDMSLSSSCSPPGPARAGRGRVGLSAGTTGGSFYFVNSCPWLSIVRTSTTYVRTVCHATRPADAAPRSHRRAATGRSGYCLIHMSNHTRLYTSFSIYEIYTTIKSDEERHDAPRWRSCH